MHWEHVPALQEAFPHLRLTRSLFELDGDRITCSGGVAGLDMMVALITRDHGYHARGSRQRLVSAYACAGRGQPQRMELRFRLGLRMRSC